ncbi:universal stress protein [Desulforhopalus singaporensis]|uniref:Nucleotide-binding universal stress protein, UspA family n=1 Tax=Desulforhopalus singaporensis TaxID=91360 RepID=A0A1H0VDR3_9BACT|nr:universal stress protein [Desulforhopalus singaporensis]SDP76236.1 Nucleotide-binding universal stress protein, UspA family [Desulforhopalus singaporensis]
MKYLVGYDALHLNNSEQSVGKKALEVACKFAKENNANICIMASLEQRPNMPKEEVEKVKNHLDELKLLYKFESLSFETLVSVNYFTPGEDLVNFAKDNGIDLLFVGVRNRSKVSKIMFGSNAQHIILNSPCPVVTVR